jgi:DNA polymerase-3 subunit delta
MAAKKKTKQPIHLIFGGDEYLVTSAAKELVDSLCPRERQQTDLDIIQGDVANAEGVLDAMRQTVGALYQVGLFGGDKVIWLKDASFFGSAGSGRSKAAKDQVKQFVEKLDAGLPDGHELVISASGVDKRGAFYKTVKAIGTIKEFASAAKSYSSLKEAKEAAKQLLLTQGLSGSDRSVDYLLSRTGTDTRQIANEIEKLDIFLGGRKEFTDADIRTIVSPSNESAVWDLSEAIADGNINVAIEKLEELLTRKESPVRIILDLSRRFRELVVLRECLDRGWLKLGGRGGYVKTSWVEAPGMDGTLSRLDQDPRKMHPFKCGLMAVQARGFSLAALDQCKRSIGDTYALLTSSRIPGHILLEHLLLKLFMLKHGGAA